MTAASAASDSTARTAAPASPPVGFGTRVSYGAGAMANGIKGAAFSSYLMLYFNQVVGVPAAIVGTALACTLLVDAIVDPFLGRWADVTRSRWGRRHPFMYAAAIPTTIFFFLTWFPPQGLSHVQLGFWIFAFAAATRAAISAFEINASAMAPELTGDYTERTRLFSLRYWFGYAGVYGFTAFSLAFIFIESPEYPRGQLNPASYANFAALGAVLIFLAILVCAAGTHNRIPYLRQADPVGSAPKLRLRDHLAEMFAAFRNRAFLAIFGFGVFKYTAIGLYSATTLYFSTFLFKLDTTQLALLTLDSFVAATIAAPLAPIFSRWFGKRTSSMVFAVLGVAIGLSPLLLSLLGLFFEPGDPLLVPTLFVIGAVYGAMVAISLINTSSMLADVVEDSAVETGRHTAGTFFAASSFMQQCSNALGIFVAGLVLAWSEFPEQADPATIAGPVVDSLLLHYIPTSISLWTIGALILVFYPITRARHERNMDILRAREAEALEQQQRDAPLGGPAR
ncbi:MFS transporter [Pelagerythrobacter rhizovicinus]|uniref:MFS transporter n=1 Tax=Pelagerythrobacter rhizovicinus TaxID=2268576 RepID=A0A4Q2KK18_9SPHN|nr:MFS transporter [Pelagerythrobacter rhizovicinus]RXZ65595.1 MFS transporter [Pelagerythrobacter rhizovicinus]